MSWFTVEKINDATLAISEYGHWEEPHCYLLLGSSKAVLIDTGLGVESIKGVVEQLTNLPVQVVITHAHWDHIGGAKEFSNISIHHADREWLEYGLPISDKVIQDNFAKRATTKPLPTNFDLTSYTTPKLKPSVILKDGDKINLGKRTIEIIHTPGHSPGSICVYDSSNGYLFTGDTLYEGTLHMNYESTDPLAFARSIDRLSHLNKLKLILPGHYKLELPPSLLTEARAAFRIVSRKQALYHGSGFHKFGNINLLV